MKKKLILLAVALLALSIAVPPVAMADVPICPKGIVCPT